MVGNMLPGNGNNLVDGAKFIKAWKECTLCHGHRVVPLDLSNSLDDERTQECPMCEGYGGWEVEKLV